MGRVEEMPEPGDYLVRDLRVAHTSILIVPWQGRPNPRISQYVRPSRQSRGLARKGQVPGRIYLQIPRLGL